jgi:hypothetical protein
MVHGHIEGRRITLITGIRGTTIGGRKNLWASMEEPRGSTMTLGQILGRGMVLKGYIQGPRGLKIGIITFTRMEILQLLMNGVVRFVDDDDQCHRRKEIENMIFLVQMENIQRI